MKNEKAFSFLLVSLISLKQRFSDVVDDIDDSTFRVFTRMLDSLEKENGVVNKYNQIIRNSDNTVTPFRGTVYLMDLLKITPEKRLIIYPDYYHMIKEMEV